MESTGIKEIIAPSTIKKKVKVIAQSNTLSHRKPYLGLSFLFLCSFVFCMDQGNTAVIQSPSFIREDVTTMRVNVNLDEEFFIAKMVSEFTSNVLRLGIICWSHTHSFQITMSIAGVVPPTLCYVNTWGSERMTALKRLIRGCKLCKGDHHCSIGVSQGGCNKLLLILRVCVC